MKKLNKLALAIGAVAISGAASAVDLTLQESGVVYENISGLTVDSNGDITVTGAVLDENTIPALGGSFHCDSDTTVAMDLLDGSGNPYPDESAVRDNLNDTCVGTGASDPSVYCDTANGLYFDPVEELCVIPDTTPPTLAISVSPASLADGEDTATVTFTFDEPVTGFAKTDVVVTNGEIDDPVMQSSTATEEVWTAQFTRTGNITATATITVAAGRYADALGNQNTQGATASIDLEGPQAACDLRYEGVAVHEENAIFQWDTGTSQIPMYLTRDEVHAYPFTSTSNPAYNGQLAVAPFSNTGKVEKDIWISECPGGEPIAGSPYAGVCEKDAKQTSLYWEQGGDTSWRCTLDTNTPYYFNVRNQPGSCSQSSGCDAKVQLITAGSPD